MADEFVLDQASILGRLGGDEEIYAMMVDLYLDHVDNNCAALTAAFNDGDTTVLRREAHTIKGLLASFSDHAGVTVALYVEQMAQQGDIAALGEAVAGLKQRLREVGAVLSAG